jgi:hypothetical protein
MFDELDAGFAGAGLAAPQPKIAANSECPADRGKVLCLLRQRLGRPVSRGETQTAGCAMGNDMRGRETPAACERSRHLPGSWPGRLEQDRLDPRPQ